MSLRPGDAYVLASLPAAAATNLVQVMRLSDRLGGGADETRT